MSSYTVGYNELGMGCNIYRTDIIIHPPEGGFARFEFRPCLFGKISTIHADTCGKEAVIRYGVRDMPVPGYLQSDVAGEQQRGIPVIYTALPKDSEYVYTYGDCILQEKVSLDEKMVSLHHDGDKNGHWIVIRVRLSRNLRKGEFVFFGFFSNFLLPLYYDTRTYFVGYYTMPVDTKELSVLPALHFDNTETVVEYGDWSVSLNMTYYTVDKGVPEKMCVSLSAPFETVFELMGEYDPEFFNTTCCFKRKALDAVSVEERFTRAVCLLRKLYTGALINDMMKKTKIFISKLHTGLIMHDSIQKLHTIFLGIRSVLQMAFALSKRKRIKTCTVSLYSPITVRMLISE